MINIAKDRIAASKYDKYIIPLYARVKYAKNNMYSYLKVIRGTIQYKKREKAGKLSPKIIQLPITNSCNLNCQMCNVPNIKEDDFDILELKSVIDDKAFANIQSVGINGGEPFLKRNIIEYVDLILRLPKIKSISIISNGTITNVVLSKLKEIYVLCKKENVRLNISFSLDGYRDTHDIIRGVKGAFDKTISTIEEINLNKELYCDGLGLICTISKYNVYMLSELEAFIKLNNLPAVKYQIAVKHKRLNNEGKYDDFSVQNDKHMSMIAREFMFKKFNEMKDPYYYFLFKFIKNGYSGRMVSCVYDTDTITIDASGNLCYCAVESDAIGHITEPKSIYEQINNKESLEYKREIMKRYCDECGHYSESSPFLQSYKELTNYNYERSVWAYRYLR